jgi:hypothetical protein
MLIHSRVASLAKHHLQLHSLLFCHNVLADFLIALNIIHRPIVSLGRIHHAVDNESYTDFHRPESHMDQHLDFEQVGLLKHGKVMTVATIESGSPSLAEIPPILPCFEVAVTNSIRIRKDRFIPRFHLRRRRRMTTYIFSPTTPVEFDEHYLVCDSRRPLLLLMLSLSPAPSCSPHTLPLQSNS